MVNEHVKANTHFFFFWKYLENVVQKQKRLLQAQQRDIKYLERKEVETEKKEAEKRKLQATSIAKLASKITHNKRVKVRRKTYSRGFFYHHLIITLCSLSTIKASGTEKKNKKVRPNKVVFGWVHVAECVTIKTSHSISLVDSPNIHIKATNASERSTQKEIKSRVRCLYSK